MQGGGVGALEKMQPPQWEPDGLLLLNRIADLLCRPGGSQAGGALPRPPFVCRGDTEAEGGGDRSGG